MALELLELDKVEQAAMSKSRIVAGLLSLNFWNGISMGVLTIAIPLYAASIKATTVQIGIVGAASWVGVMLVSLPAGFLVDRYYDWQALFVGGTIVSALFVISLPLINLPWLLLVPVLLRGIPQTISHISVSATFLKKLAVMGEEKAGWHRASLSLGGSFIGPMLGGYAIKQLGFHGTFALVGILTLAAAMAVYIACRGRVIKRSPHKIKIGEFITGRRNDFKRLIRQRTLVQASVVEGLATATMTVFGVFTPVLVLRKLHLASDYAGIIVAMEGLAYILTLLLGGGLLKRLDRRRHYLVGSILSIGGLIILGSVSAPQMMPIGSSILGIGLAVIAFATFSLLAKIEGDKGTVFGFYGICLGIFAVLGPIVTGVIGRILGVQAIFWVLVPLFSLVVAYAMLGARESAVSPR